MDTWWQGIMRRIRRDPGRYAKGGAAWPLSQRLVSFGPRIHLTIGQAVEGILILGGTGSGKSSGSGQLVALSFLEAGFGGVILVVKPEERRMWEAYCRAAGRLSDLIVFGPEHKWRFNFMDYELNRKGRGGGLTENLRNLINNVAGITKHNASKGGGQEDGQYWEGAKDQLLRNLLDLLIMAKGRITIADMHELLMSAATSAEMANSDRWRRGSFCFQCLMKAREKPKSPSQEKDFDLLAAYWLVQYPQLAEKTRSIIASSYTALVDVLNRSLLRDLFCEDTNLTPQAIEDGKILLIDLPVKEFGEVGQYGAGIWKYCFQQAIERRNPLTSPRPVFIWQDEGQMFTLPSDVLFQSTCRSARVSTVVLTQNVSGFYASMGQGQQSEPLVDSLFANLNLKILHANSDATTNTWAAELIGRTSRFLVNANQSYEGDDMLSTLMGMGSPRSNAGITEQIQFAVEPSVFSSGLRTGGPHNDFFVDAILFCPSMCAAATGRAWMPVTFKQSV